MPVRGWAAAVALLAACAGEQSVSLDAAPIIDASSATDAGRVRFPDARPPPERPIDPRGGPPYPIVLAHGFFGFEDFAGAGFATYFYGVRESLARTGETVFTPAVDPFNDSESRGEELIAQIEAILAQTGHAKVNLIAHSQGGIDARYVASVRPDLVASVTTIASPHRGTPIADIALGLVEDPRARQLIDRLVRWIGAPLWDASGEETSVVRSMQQLSTEGMREFNERHPNVPGIRYFSVAGRTDGATGYPDCDLDQPPQFMVRYAFFADSVEPLLDIAEQIVDGGSDDVANDGLVRVFDSRWGEFLGCIPADHLDEVGHLFGDVPGRDNDFDHRTFYAELIAYLRTQGL